MFADQRLFRAVAFRTERLNDFDALRAVFDVPVVSFGEVVNFGENVIADSSIQVQHMKLRSASRFTISPLLEQARVVGSENPLFDYDFYVINLLLEPQPVGLLAVPFRGMYGELLPLIVAPDGSAPSFLVLQLAKAVETIASTAPEGGLISVTSFEAIVEGDPNVRVVQLTGSDTIHSDMYGVFDSSRRFRLMPKKCTFTYDDHNGKVMQFTSDRYGNYAFRIGAKARNLISLPDVFEFFLRREVTRSSWSSPLDRVEEKETRVDETETGEDSDEL
ncbi:MAG: hypothetical protein ACJ8GN_00950 [Longimicrobiaceae bacterium]